MQRLRVASEALPQCSHQGAIPLYLVAIGYIVKTVFAMGIEYWLAKRQAKEVPKDADTGAGASDDCRYVPMGMDMDMEEPKNCCRQLWNSCVKCLQVCWTAFKFITPLYQLVIDSLQVQSSGTKHGWHRYQCYAQVFSNSPNVATLFVLFGIMEWKYRTSKTWEKIVMVYGPRLVWLGAYVMCPLITHVGPFIVVYIWVNLVIVFAGSFLAYLGIHVVVELVFDVDTDNRAQVKAAGIQLMSQSVGLMLVLVFALGTSSMIRLYSGDSSYIDSLWLAMSERKTEDFLCGEVQTAMEARNRWYSFIHFFI